MFNLFKKKQVLAAVTKLNETLEAAMAEETPAEEAPAGKVYTEDEIKISAKEISGKVELVDGEGNLQPATDGDYVHADGNTYTVKDGQIEAINGEKGEEKPAEEAPDEEPVEATEETPVEEPAVEEPKEEEKPSEEIEVLKAEVEALKKIVSELQAAITGAASKEDVQGLSTEFNKMNENLKFLASVPAEASKTTTSTVTKESNKQKVDNLKAVFGVK